MGHNYIGHSNNGHNYVGHGSVVDDYATHTGEYVVLVAWAAPGLAYPITRGHDGADCDYVAGSTESRFYSVRGEPAVCLRAANYRGHNYLGEPGKS